MERKKRERGVTREKGGKDIGWTEHAPGEGRLEGRKGRKITSREGKGPLERKLGETA